MVRGTKVSTETRSPSAFMRQLRPELYSDTIDRTTYQLDAPTLGYHLETITARNQTHDFEIFCRKLCERTICPNLKPATGRDSLDRLAPRNHPSDFNKNPPAITQQRFELWLGTVQGSSLRPRACSRVAFGR
jgi:hypothetical protein